jgi:hypothetical protein
VLFAALGQGIDGYRALFIASTLARAAAMILLVRVTGIDVPVVRLIVRTISVRPWEGGLGRPIHSTIRSIYRSGRRDEE